jgi:hypothetical protein
MSEIGSRRDSIGAGQSTTFCFRTRDEEHS